MKSEEGSPLFSPRMENLLVPLFEISSVTTAWMLPARGNSLERNISSLDSQPKVRTNVCLFEGEVWRLLVEINVRVWFEPKSRFPTISNQRLQQVRWMMRPFSSIFSFLRNHQFPLSRFYSFLFHRQILHYYFLFIPPLALFCWNYINWKIEEKLRKIRCFFWKSGCVVIFLLIGAEFYK